MPKLTRQRLLEVLDYDQCTGIFKWKSCFHKSFIGAVSGCKRGDGYIVITIDGEKHLAHRLAWLFVHGHFPHPDIDHIDNDKSNNRINNLREATKKINAQNRVRAVCGNKSGFLGVSPMDGKWRATIMIDGKQFFIGRFRDPAEAHAAYVRVKREMHPGFTL